MVGKPVMIRAGVAPPSCRRINSVIHVCTLLVLLFMSSASAQESRRILAIYDDVLHKDIFHSEIHQMAEMPLNHLGMIVDYQGLSQLDKISAQPVNSHGILVWLDGTHPQTNIDRLCLFLNAQMHAGKPVVILGGVEIRKSEKKQMQASCLETYNLLGVSYEGEFADDVFFFDIKNIDSSMVEFERKFLLAENGEYVLLKKNRDDVKNYLEMERRDLKDSVSTLVFTSKNGAVARHSTIYFRNREIGKRQWRINPFKFFEEAYRIQGSLRPDATTLNGHRIFYSHIDGDGIFNLSMIDRKSYSGEVILDRVIKKYADYPVTVSLITGYFDDPHYNSNREKNLYTLMFSQKNVEAAAHGYAHPLVWKTGKPALNIPGYKHSDEREIVGSVADVNKLLNRLGINKKTSLFQWTGDCLPSDKQLAMTGANNIISINGGDTRYDRERDSVSFVAPLGIRKGGALQVYTGSPNENIYTELWHDRYYGYRDVVQTFQNTEVPRRLKPVNVYYHFYAAERAESLSAIDTAYAYVVQNHLASILTSEYVRMVHDFFAMEIKPAADGFYIKNRGDLRTLRLDDTLKIPDLARSRGILGYKIINGSLYIHLDEGNEHHLVMAKKQTKQVLLESVNGYAKNMQLTNLGGKIEIGTWAKGNLVLAGFDPGREYKVKMLAGKDVMNRVVTTTVEGKLVVSAIPTNFPSDYTQVNFERVTP